MLAKIQSHNTILYFCFNLKLKKMKRLLFFIPIFFMLTVSERPGRRSASSVPEVPSISENDKEGGKVIKVEVVNDSSLDAAYPKG